MQWMNWGGRGAGLRQDNAAWFGMPLFRCHKEHVYILRVAEIVNLYVHVMSSNVLAANLDFFAFDKHFYQLPIYSHFDY